MKTIFVILFAMLFVVGAIEGCRISNLAGVIMLAIGVAGMALRVKMMEMKGAHK